MTLWVKHTKAERIALLQRAEEKFRSCGISLVSPDYVTQYQVTPKYKRLFIKNTCSLSDEVWISIAPPSHLA